MKSPACRAWGVEAFTECDGAKIRPSEDSLFRIRRLIAKAMGQEADEKWTVAVNLQPTLRKSDRLLAHDSGHTFTQTTPHLFRWLTFTNRLGEADNKGIADVLRVEDMTSDEFVEIWQSAAEEVWGKVPPRSRRPCVT